MAALKLSQKVSASREVSGAPDVDKLVREFLGDLRTEREVMVCMTLNSKNVVRGIHAVHVGTVNMSVVGPREILRAVCMDNAASFILAHNRPSGDPTPSPEDIDVTTRMAKLGNDIDAPFLDHLIIGETRYVSLKERGTL